MKLKKKQFERKAGAADLQARAGKIGEEIHHRVEVPREVGENTPRRRKMTPRRRVIHSFLKIKNLFSEVNEVKLSLVEASALLEQFAEYFDNFNAKKGARGHGELCAVSKKDGRRDRTHII